MLKKVLGVLIVVIVIGAAIPAVWPTFIGTDTAIQALTETDQGTVMLQTFWPIMTMVIALAIAAGLVFFALRKFDICDN